MVAMFAEHVTVPAERSTAVTFTRVVVPPELRRRFADSLCEKTSCCPTSKFVISSMRAAGSVITFVETEPMMPIAPQPARYCFTATERESVLTTPSISVVAASIQAFFSPLVRRMTWPEMTPTQ
jgi:hypothetical protein